MVDQPEVTRAVVDGRTLRLTSLSKVLFLATETTKGEVLAHYAAVAPLLLPHLRDRPVTRVRWPHGVGSEGFFEKNVPAGAPDWLPRTRIDDVTYPHVDDVAALSYLVNLNAIELHVPQWRVDRETGERRNPDRLVIDLDPGTGAGLLECATVALAVRERLGGLGMELHPVTSGSKGMQLYAALGGDLTSDQVRDLAKTLAGELVGSMPQLVVSSMTKSIRPGKVLLDWSQNVAAKTTITPYALRGRELPCVATPRTWEEVETGADGGRFEQVLVWDLPPRLEKHGDLLADLAP